MTSVCKMIELTSIKHDRLVKKITSPLLHHFGITYFAYQFVSNNGDWFTLGNNPDWLLHSAEHEFFKYDPSLVRPDHYIRSSICFPQNHQHEAFQRTLIGEAIELFDLDHALAIIEPNVSGCEYYFFAAPKQHHRVADIYLAQLTSLRRDYTRYIQTHLQPIYDHCLAHTVKLNEVNPIGFNSPHNILSVAESNTQEVAFLSAIKDIPLLTAREQHCLRLYQQGLTAKQTARKMNLSHRTIEDHFERIKTKYGVESKRALLNEPVVNTVMSNPL